jgi:hypothetical protein
MLAGILQRVNAHLAHTFLYRSVVLITGDMMDLENRHASVMIIAAEAKGSTVCQARILLRLLINKNQV